MSSDCEDEAIALAKLIAACTPPPQPVNRKRSFVWKYFEFRGGDKSAVYCKICEKGLRFRDSTSALQYHLKNVHGVHCDQLSINLESSPSEKVNAVNANAGNDVNLCEAELLARNAQVSSAIFRFVVEDMHDPAIVEGNGFRKLLEGLVPRFDSASDLSGCVYNSIDTEFERVRIIIQQELDATSHATVSLESWEDESGTRSHVLLTAHFLNEEWKTLHRTLSTCQFDSVQLTTVEVADSLCSALAKWRILEKCTLVSESNPEMATIARLAGVSHWPCVADALNQALIRDAVGTVPEVKDILHKAEEFYYFVYEKKKESEPPDNSDEDSSQDKYTFNHIDSTNHDRNSFLDLITLPDPELGLSATEHQHCLNCLTLNIILSFMQSNINLLKSLIIENDRQDLFLCSQEVEILQQVLEFLKVINETVDAMCKVEFPLVSTAAALLWNIRKVCIGRREDLGIMEEFKSVFLKSLENRLCTWNEFSTLCMLMDPNHKKLAVDLCTEHEDFMLQSCLKLYNSKENNLRNYGEDNGEKYSIHTAAKRRKMSIPRRRSGMSNGSKLLDLVDKLSKDKIKEETENNAQKQILEKEIQTYFKIRAFSVETEIGNSACDWWRTRENQFPCLARIAKSIFTVPSVHKPSVRAFRGNLDSCYTRRSRLGRHLVEKIVFLKENKID